MKNWLKKVLSLLTAIALLVSVAALAFAEESNEPIDITNAEEVSLNNNETSEQAAAEEAARLAAEQAAAEEAARLAAEQAAAEEAARLAAEQAAAEEAARLAAEQAAAEEAARKAEEEAAGKAAEQDAAQKANDEAEGKADEGAEKQDAEPVSSYYNEDETITDDEGTYPVADLFTFEDGDNGSVDDVTVEEMGLVVTTEMKFPEATALNLNDIVTGTLDAETIGEYIIHWDSNRVIVLDLETSSDDVEVVINDKAVQFEKTEGSENNSTYGMMIAAEGEYHIVLTSSNPVSYTLTVKDAYAEATKTEANEENEEENNEGKNDENKQEGNNEIPEGTEAGDENLNNNENETEGNGDIDGETNTNEETPEIEYPVIKGWITTDAETFEIGSTVILKAESDIDLGDMIGWQTKVRNENGEEVWKTITYGKELEVELTEETINNVYRFRMEYDNYSDEFSFIKEEETEETEETEEEILEGETKEGGTEETKQTEEGTEVTEEVDEATKMAELGYTKIVVTAEEGADLYAAADRESEVTGHLDPETEAWVLLNEEATWGQLYSEDEEAAAQFIFLEDVEVVATEEAEEETEEEFVDESENMTALGYTKVIVTAEEGADLYAEASKESEVLDHLDPETEAWVLLNEDQTWGQLYSEDEEAVAQFISMEDVAIIEEEKEALTDEEMLELGYIKVVVALTIGADLYDSTLQDANIIGHLDNGEELWIKLIEGAERGLVYSADESEKAYINLVDLIAIMKPDGVEELPTRYIELHSNLEGYDFVYYGTTEVLTLTMKGFQEDDNYTIQWKYSADNGKSYSDIEGADEEEYMYVIDEENFLYAWKVVVNLLPKEEIEEEISII